MTDSGNWIILTCASVATLRLADSLVSAGFDAWTPREEVRRPVRGKFEWVMRPMFPSFVFARADRLDELSAMARSPAQVYLAWDADRQCMVAKGHPFFRLFHVGDEFSLSRDSVRDHELAPIRAIEGRRKRKPRGKPREFHCGDRVRLTEGAYEGLRGVVVSTRGKTARVSFPGSRLDFDFPAWVLIPVLDIAPQASLHESQFRDAA